MKTGLHSARSQTDRTDGFSHAACSGRSESNKTSILKREVKIKYINTYRLRATLHVLCTILDAGSIFPSCALHFELPGSENVSVSPFLNDIHRSNSGFRPLKYMNRTLRFHILHSVNPKILSIQCRNMGLGRHHMFLTCGRNADS